MSEHVIETVTFRLCAGVSRADFTSAAQRMNTWLAAQPGFVTRHLSCTGNGSWIEHIRWQDMASARAAAAGIGQTPDTAAFLAAIDGPTVHVQHSELDVTLP